MARSRVSLALSVGVIALALLTASPVSAGPVWRRPWPTSATTSTSTTTTVRPTTTTSTSTTTSTTAPPSAACGGPLAKASGGYWQCALDENFNGTALNRNLWAPITTAASGFHSGPECLVDSPSNVAVGGGVLTLTVRKEAAPFTCQDADSGPFTTQYTSEQVATYGTFAQAYGRFEVRAKVPSTPIPGLQSAFWLWPQDQFKYGAWPLSGEIDIAETFSRWNDRAVPFIHYNNYLDYNVTNYYCVVGDLGQFHTYSLEWTPQTLTIAYDGQTCLVSNWQPMAPQVKPQPFDQPFFIALTQLLGVEQNAFDAATTPLPASTQVDYVRVWK